MKVMGWDIKTLGLRGLAVMLLSLAWTAIMMAVGLGAGIAFIATGGKTEVAGVLLAMLGVILTVFVDGLIASYVVEKWIKK